jgi:hypothetical protein
MACGGWANPDPLRQPSAETQYNQQTVADNGVTEADRSVSSQRTVGPVNPDLEQAIGAGDHDGAAAAAQRPQTSQHMCAALSGHALRSITAAHKRAGSYQKSSESGPRLNP